MQTEFITARFPESEMERKTGREAMLARTTAFVRKHADRPQRRSRLREAGRDFGPWKSPQEIIGQVERRTAVMGCGPKLICQREHDREQLSIRELEAEVPHPDLGCAPELERIHFAVWDEFNDVRSGGRFLCRFIDGTSTVSKHGYLTDEWRGAAEDIFREGDMDDLIAVANFIVVSTTADHLKASRVIVDDRIWDPDSGWHPYGGNRHFHCHVEVEGGHACSP